MRGLTCAGAVGAGGRCAPRLSAVVRPHPLSVRGKGLGARLGFRREQRMPLIERTRLVVAATAMWTAVGLVGPLHGQGKESEADRVQRGCGPADIKHGVRISAVGAWKATADKALVHVVRP